MNEYMQKFIEEIDSTLICNIIQIQNYLKCKV